MAKPVKKFNENHFFSSGCCRNVLGEMVLRVRDSRLLSAVVTQRLRLRMTDKQGPRKMTFEYSEFRDYSGLVLVKSISSASTTRKTENFKNFHPTF